MRVPVLRVPGWSLRMRTAASLTYVLTHSLTCLLYLPTYRSQPVGKRAQEGVASSDSVEDRPGQSRVRHRIPLRRLLRRHKQAAALAERHDLKGWGWG